MHKLILLITFITGFTLFGKAQDVTDTTGNVISTDSTATVSDSLLQKIDSFYIKRNIDLTKVESLDLYYEIYRWYRTCYKWGGNSQKGIDCSHFVNMLYEKIYRKTLGPSAGAILTQCKLLKKGLAEAKEGDIIFFKIKKGQISHVGIYLQNNRFAHASTHAGVVISNMDEAYYKKHFYKVGRVKTD